MLTHLYTNGAPPYEYTELQLWRDVYHCDPATIDPLRVLRHITCLTEETKWRRGNNG